MLWWLIGVAVFVVIYGRLWQTQPKLAFGVLLGLILAYFFSIWMRPYLTGMETIPLWLPPLPLTIIAVSLLVAGALIWLRADNLPPVKRDDDAHGHDGHH
jgi:hypothetical protein